MDSLKALLRALLAQIPEDASPRVIVVKSDAPPTNSPARGNGSKTRSNQPAYDPAVVFVLELSTILALRDRETVEELGKDVADALQTVIRDAANIHPVVVSRSVYYLLTLLRASNVSAFLVRTTLGLLLTQTRSLISSELQSSSIPSQASTVIYSNKVQGLC